jgi:hypothetical protein
MEAIATESRRNAGAHRNSQIVVSHNSAIRRLRLLESAGWDLDSLRDGDLLLDLSRGPEPRELGALAGLAGILSASGIAAAVADGRGLSVGARSIAPRGDARVLAFALFAISGIRAGVAAGAEGRPEALVLASGRPEGPSPALRRLLEDRLLWLGANAVLLEAEGNRLERLARAFDLEYGPR